MPVSWGNATRVFQFRQHAGTTNVSSSLVCEWQDILVIKSCILITKFLRACCPLLVI